MYIIYFRILGIEELIKFFSIIDMCNKPLKITSLLLSKYTNKKFNLKKVCYMLSKSILAQLLVDFATKKEDILFVHILCPVYCVPWHLRIYLTGFNEICCNILIYVVWK